MSIVGPQKISEDLNRLLFSCLWGGKTHKLKGKNASADYLNDGLRVADIYNFEKSLKLWWIKYIFVNIRVGM